MKFATGIALTGFAASSTALPQSRNSTSFKSTQPMVDLGHEDHQAKLQDTSSGDTLYTFSNIRFGQAPIGPLRFAAPVAPSNSSNNTKAVNDGSQGAICPQANPAWLATTQAFLPTYLRGGNISSYATSSHLTAASNAVSSSIYALSNVAIPTPGPNESEDCLFLDVVVAKKIFDSASGSSIDGTVYGKKEKSRLAPVLVWIYGGGYVSGSKNSAGESTSLIASSITNSSKGIVYVAMNYRLGLYGWLAGSDDNIHLFGGDASRVTVMGESAGGGSIMHHITSPSAPLFQAAIPQSPAYQPYVPKQLKQTLRTVLKTASAVAGQPITSANALRHLPFKALYAVNAITIGQSSYGTFTFGPVPLGDYVPDLPIRRLTQGKYHKNISVLAGHNANEGLLFTPPYVQDENMFVQSIKMLFPTVSTSDLKELIKLYPPPTGSATAKIPYTNMITRTATGVGDFLVGCNAHFLSQRLGYGYLFDVPSALHGGDVPYTFFGGANSTSDGTAVYPQIAAPFQYMLTSFATHGEAALKAQGVAKYASGEKVINIGPEHFGAQIRDPADREKQCRFWAEAPYFPQH